MARKRNESQPMSPPLNAPIGLPLSAEQRSKLERLARSESRTMAGWIRRRIDVATEPCAVPKPADDESGSDGGQAA